jgi:hypothetical protein
MSLLRVLPIALCLLIPVARVSAQEGQDKPAKPAADAAHKTDTMYAVVKIGPAMKVVKSTEIAALKTKVTTDHDKAMKEYESAKKKAEADKKPFNGQMPVAQDVVVVKQDFKTMAEAEAFVKKEMEAKKKGADPMKKDAPAAHPTDKPHPTDKK